MPARPRRCSATCGFFFCGIIELPIATRSSSSASPNSWLVKITTSSPSRERCTNASVQAYSRSHTKSRSETASIVFEKEEEKPSSAAVQTGSSGRLEPASAPAPSVETSAAS